MFELYQCPECGGYYTTSHICSEQLERLRELEKLKPYGPSYRIKPDGTHVPIIPNKKRKNTHQKRG